MSLESEKVINSEKHKIENNISNTKESTAKDFLLQFPHIQNSLIIIYITIIKEIEFNEAKISVKIIFAKTIFFHLITNKLAIERNKIMVPKTIKTI